MAVTEGWEIERPVVEALRRGDRHAFETLVRTCDRWVRGVIFGVLGNVDRVDDVVQHTWLSVWQRAGELRDVDRWRAWLYRLARNAALDAGRDIARRRRHEPGPPADDVPRPVETGTGEAVLLAAEQHRDVMQAVAGLPALYREPFVLRHLNGWSYQEIADVMDMPVDSVETRLVRARRMLRQALQHRLGMDDAAAE